MAAPQQKSAEPTVITGTPPQIPTGVPQEADQKITLNLAELTQLIAGVVAQQTGMGAAPGLGAQIAEGIAKAQRRAKTYGEYVATTGSYYHPDPNKKIALTRKCFQNGGEIMITNIYDEEAELLNRLTHSGRYLDRLVEVSIRDTGGDTAEVHLNYNNKIAGLNAIKEKLERRKSDKSTLMTILRMIVEEQEIEDLEVNDKLEQQAARRVALAQAAGK